MKEIKYKWDIVYISDKVLGYETDKKDDRPCIVINNPEEDRFGLVLSMTTKGKSDYGVNQIRLSNGSYISKDQRPKEIDYNYLLWSGSESEKIDAKELSEKDKEELSKVFNIDRL